ncbi:EamA family transporter [Epibacterium sp. SM1969]|uniref:EamA family transporter n=1 Tax=Tritonibacter aquimaris TaxID=2663379 RepID=A0A844AJD5_9RHOB|nr:DMT family transporter [Tritonibacter aquimaris]MQY41370.1 EamA family transporter [Tritonibacter aquimaris]
MTTEVVPEQSVLFRTVLWMSGGIVSFSAMAVAGRELSATHDTFEIMAFRSLVSMLIVFAALSLTKSWSQVRRERLPQHMLRNVAHFTGQNLWFWAIAVAPLAQVFALEFTSPLWAMVLASVLLKDQIRRVQVVAALIGFAGILIVTRPGVGVWNIGIPLAAIAAFFFALTNVVTKSLTKVEGIGSILFWLTTLQLVFGVVAMGYDGVITWPTWQTAPWLVLVGICGLSAHFCLANALAIAPISVVTPIDFVRLPAIALVGMVLYNEAIDIWVITGAVVIFAGNYLNITASRRSL